MLKRIAKSACPQIAPDVSRVLEALCCTFCQDLLRTLDRQLDRHLVETFFALVLVLLVHRHGMHGMPRSEISGWLVGACAAVAGTKRLKKLLYSVKWQAALVADLLWHHADQALTEIQAVGETPLFICDESVLEKNECRHLEESSPVRSEQAARVARIKPGFFNPHAERWGRQVVHVWDRGFAGAPWLRAAVPANVPFVVRSTKTTSWWMLEDSPNSLGRFIAAIGRKGISWFGMRGAENGPSLA